MIWIYRALLYTYIHFILIEQPINQESFPPEGSKRKSFRPTIDWIDHIVRVSKWMLDRKMESNFGSDDSALRPSHTRGLIRISLSSPPPQSLTQMHRPVASLVDRALPSTRRRWYYSTSESFSRKGTESACHSSHSSLSLSLLSAASRAKFPRYYLYDNCSPRILLSARVGGRVFLFSHLLNDVHWVSVRYAAYCIPEVHARFRRFPHTRFPWVFRVDERRIFFFFFWLSAMEKRRGILPATSPNTHTYIYSCFHREARAYLADCVSARNVERIKNLVICVRRSRSTVRLLCVAPTRWINIGFNKIFFAFLARVYCSEGWESLALARFFSSARSKSLPDRVAELSIDQLTRLWESRKNPGWRVGRNNNLAFSPASHGKSK